MRRIIGEQWLLLLVLAFFIVIGFIWVVTFGESKADILFNLGIELLGTAISVLMIEFAVTKYLENREASRRRPILEVIEKQIRKHTHDLEEQLAIIGLDDRVQIASAEEMATTLSPAVLDESFEVIPGHKIRKVLHFQAASSWSRKYLRDLYEINQADLPPEMASAILKIVYVDNNRWGILASTQPVDSDYLNKVSDLILEHFDAVRALRSQLSIMREDLDLK